MDVHSVLSQIHPPSLRHGSTLSKTNPHVLQKINNKKKTRMVHTAIGDVILAMCYLYIQSHHPHPPCGVYQFGFSGLIKMWLLFQFGWLCGCISVCMLCRACAECVGGPYSLGVAWPHWMTTSFRHVIGWEARESVVEDTLKCNWTGWETEEEPSHLHRQTTVLFRLSRTLPYKKAAECETTWRGNFPQEGF